MVTVNVPPPLLSSLPRERTLDTYFIHQSRTIEKRTNVKYAGFVWAEPNGYLLSPRECLNTKRDAKPTRPMDTFKLVTVIRSER